MAIVAGGPFALMRAGVNREPGVIEHRSRPGSSRVALGAVGGEARCHVIGIGDAGVIRFVAGVAVGGRARVPAADVTTGTWSRGVRAGKWESGFAVIEAGGNPRR